MLSGLEEATSGTILINDKDIKTYNTNTLCRTFFGYVFQKCGLFPHMTVRENLEVILYLNKVPLRLHPEKVSHLLDLISLPPSTYLNRYPHELSGGEQQRVSVARALATNSECLLMDEPFGALDVLARHELQDEVLNLKKRLHKTIIFVTHDIYEAFKLGDRIIVMRDGKIEQIGTKKQLIHSPRTLFVKQFLETGLTHESAL